MSILLFLFCRLSVVRRCWFWLSVIPFFSILVLAAFIKFISCTFALVFQGRFWL